MSKETLQIDSNRFIENVKYYIENVYNLDQSDFQSELHVCTITGCILTKKGIKKVKSVNICDYARTVIQYNLLF